MGFSVTAGATVFMVNVRDALLPTLPAVSFCIAWAV